MGQEESLMELRNEVTQRCVDDVMFDVISGYIIWGKYQASGGICVQTQEFFR